MRCRHCNGKTYVVHSAQRGDERHRWLRCYRCCESTRTVETYLVPKPGPPAGSRTGPKAPGSRNGNAVLTEADVLRLREMAKGKSTRQELSMIFGISPATISRIVRRKTWTHV